MKSSYEWKETQADVTDFATLNLPINPRNFLSFYAIFQFRFGRLKVARSDISVLYIGFVLNRFINFASLPERYQYF